jgi:hypothetical protein
MEVVSKTQGLGLVRSVKVTVTFEEPTQYTHQMANLQSLASVFIAKGLSDNEALQPRNFQLELMIRAGST